MQVMSGLKTLTLFLYESYKSQCDLPYVGAMVILVRHPFNWTCFSYTHVLLIIWRWSLSYFLLSNEWPHLGTFMKLICEAQT